MKRTEMPRRKHNKAAYRSGLEKKNAQWLHSLGVPFKYEKMKIKFVQPAKDRTYTPDFTALPNGVIVETKGMFTAADRAKHLWVKEQHPDLDIRFVFSNSRSKLYKGSKTTLAGWCYKHGFQYADKLIPEGWLL